MTFNVKQNISRVEAYREAHVNKSGVFDDPVAEEYYHSLVRETDEEYERIAASGSQAPVNQQAVFEKVLGPRRGHIRGMGFKLSTMATSTDEGCSQSTQPDRFEVMLQNPKFRAAIVNLMRSFGEQNDGDDDGDDDMNE